MSKLIVETEMPTNCYDCALDCCWDEGTIPVEYSEKRKPNCPIKGVLPEHHGDLIDRDEAFYDIKRFICNGCNRETEDDCVACITKGIEDILCYIKPIIVAERKD